MKRHALAATILALLMPASATRAEDMPDMPGMTHNTPAAGDTPSTQHFKAAMANMHKAMDIPYTGNADRDFVAGMLPHHQGAVDMARVELQYGRDLHLRALARRIIAAQEKEIASMKEWQTDHPK